MLAEDWVEIMRVHDRFEADITVRFLEDHGVPVCTGGGGSTALPMISLTDVRILVPREHAERAEQVLAAMRQGRAEAHPFRNAPPPPYEPPRATRKGPFAVMLAIMVPVGGGHFYARHGAAGAILASGIVGGLLAAMLGAHGLTFASALLVLLDAALSPLAVRRDNDGRTPSEAIQRGYALAAVAAAYGVALVAGGSS
jgi:hypothetical protein